jgi:hypothetical protein
MVGVSSDLHAFPLTAPRARCEIVRASFAILFFELICIRWIPGQIRYISYFMNFILLASFLGTGLGILSSKKKLALPPFPVMLAALVALVTFHRFELTLVSPDLLYYGAGEVASSSEKYYVLPLVFTAVTLAFIPLARPLGPLLKSLPSLEAYGYDVLGSLLGIAAFFGMSACSMPPWCWFAVLGIASLPASGWRLRTLLLAALHIAAMFLVWRGTEGDYWSPYYRIHVSGGGGVYDINVNNSSHQRIQPHLAKETFYFRVYDLFGRDSFKKVLVLGAGSGSDVAIALSQGAERVDAVEIDPVIERLGRELHPEKPFQDPRVRRHIDDGRAFLRKSTEKYDLIIYALPDSLTLTSGFASLRLESFLLTVESFKAAREHLSPGGLVVAYNYYREDWLVQKLARMMEAAFGVPPYVTTYGAWGRAAVLMAGPRLEEAHPPLEAPYKEGGSGSLAGTGSPLPVLGAGRLEGRFDQPLATDDWPFVYLRQPKLPAIFIISFGVVVGIALVLLRTLAPADIAGSFNWNMFFLGAAFMLLETRSLVHFGLLFGTTWMVNSLVFFAILLSVLLAVLLSRRAKALPSALLYASLLACLGAGLALPADGLLRLESPLLRYVLASALAFAPIFVANVIFSRSFKGTESPDVGFASNLLGIMFGGMFEYLALVFGYRLLVIPIIVFYTLALILEKRASAGLRAPLGSPRPSP